MLPVILFDGSVVNAQWGELPTTIRGILRFTLDNVPPLTETRINTHFQVLFNGWRQCIPRFPSEHLDVSASCYFMLYSCLLKDSSDRRVAIVALFACTKSYECTGGIQLRYYISYGLFTITAPWPGQTIKRSNLGHNGPIPAYLLPSNASGL